VFEMMGGGVAMIGLAQFCSNLPEKNAVINAPSWNAESVARRSGPKRARNSLWKKISCARCPRVICSTLNPSGRLYAPDAFQEIVWFGFIGPISAKRSARDWICGWN
jgi:hypothetical protein